MRSTTLMLIAILFSGISFAQQHAFKNFTINENKGRTELSFSVPKEVNIKHYRVEASNDNTNFTVVATLPAKTNALQAVDYKYDVTAYDHTYYRVAKVGMNGEMPYTSVVAKRSAPKKDIRIEAVNHDNMVTAR